MSGTHTTASVHINYISSRSNKNLGHSTYRSPYHSSYMPPTIIMSPISFKQQVEQLVSELSRCIQLCQDIKSYRNVGNRHENLDRLQSTLESSERSIPMAYNTTRRLVGSQLEIGDEQARTEMDQYINDVQTKIKPKLRQIAQPSKRRSRSEQELPGFKDILNQWKSIYQEYNVTLLSLSRRIEIAEAQPTPRTPTPRSTTEITISLREYDRLLVHMKNSWEEVIVGGRYLYVNTHDPNIKQWDMPVNAYVKSKTRPAPRPARSSSYERRSPGSRMSDYE